MPRVTEGLGEIEISYDVRPTARGANIMVTVHHLEDSRSQRVLWLLEELGVEYEIELYKRDPRTMLGPDSLRQIHPLGKSPVVEDGERSIAESGAIIEYLVGQYGNGRLIPAEGSDERLAYTYWLHYAEGSLMPMMLLKLIFDRLAHPPMPLVMRPAAALIALGVKGKFITPRLKDQLDFIEGELAKSTWFAGDKFTAADIQMSFPLEAAEARGAIGEDRPRIRQFVTRIHSRPAYKRALERGGPYAYA
ncbi:MAG: glutathione S-transferase [Chromatiales bacterium]|jgi:glutathione S-transferase|nr:glutathione S-transferase [Chromatiales bacterium]